MSQGLLKTIDNRSLNADDIIPLYESDTHSIYWIGSVEKSEEPEEIECNSYLLVDCGEAYIFEPGGLSHFQGAFDKVCQKISPFEISHIFMSHQDPDVCASLPSWLQFNPDINIVCSHLWQRFLPHYMVYHAQYLAMPDEGMTINLKSGGKLHCISAPYLHSPGNMVVFDSISGFMFSGDIGAASQKSNAFKLVIEDWSEHIKSMTGFHQRYMGSTKAAAAFTASISHLPIQAMLPQHGQIFRHTEVQAFLDWFSTLPCGVDFLYPDKE
ncbi:MAG: MBL fold metallo-hydrolase [Mariprofundaceae bacterium]|nr:MBL fold metallo-hydrolase [Mariprofundaceae bacterium]